MIAEDKERFNALLEHASLGIIETNHLAEIINVNSYALTLFGFEKSELINRRIEQLIPARFHVSHLEHREEYMRQPKSRPMGGCGYGFVRREERRHRISC